MTYQLVPKPAFLHDLILLPREVQKKVLAALPRIEQDPFQGFGHAKKVFKHLYSNVFRYRIGDYRILYCVGEGCGAALAVGPRGDIYERFRPSDLAVRETPEIAPVPIIPAPGVAAYTGEEVQQTFAADEDENELLPTPDRTPGFFRQLLGEWGVPAESHDAILQCERIDDLLEVGLDDEIVERILHWQQPPHVAAIVDQPTLDVPDVHQVEQYLEGSLKRFLLKLDPDQEKVARRSGKGAQLVKGGPGTGKSLVALYHIRHRVLTSPTPLRVLFVTYTRALTRASRQLLDDLLGDRRNAVDVETLDAVVRSVVLSGGGTYTPSDQGQREAALRWARASVLNSVPEPVRKTLESIEDSYLLDEIDWVIEGRQITSLEAYLAENRAGRGVRFDGRVRRVVWSIATQFRQRLASQKAGTFNAFRAEAIRLLREGKTGTRYDLVVIDEAQDLPPVALAFCAELAPKADGLYVTADPNQSIYGHGYGWARVHQSFDFRGRTSVLRRNYRSTRQIAEVARALMQGDEMDSDGMLAEASREGTRPILVAATSNENQVASIGDLVLAAADELRVPTHMAAVLVRAERTGQAIAKGLRDLGLDARFVRGNDLDLDAAYIKVLTMHSAKGLEFPIVAIPNLERGILPNLSGANDPDAREERVRDERRLLFVAITRAMRRLIMTYDQARPSPFVASLQQSCDFTSV